MALRFASMRTVRLDLPDGEWIEIKAELTAGELRAAETGAMVALRTGEDGKTNEIKLDWKRYSVERAVAYITAWSAKDDAGKPVPFTRDAVMALDADSFAQIENAITAYLDERDKAKKQMTAGLSAPVST